MLAWQHPAALWALMLVAAPVVIHLLRTHHAKRVAFPTLRFVQPSRAAAVRMRLPSDVLLMVVRMGVVLFAAAAAAGPIFLTDARLGAWNARVSRAVVVDTSRSMRESRGAGAVPAGAAQEAADAEVRTAAFGARFGAERLADGVARAARWLAAQPPARREIVVVSDLQVSALVGFASDVVPPETGLRFVQVGAPVERRDFSGEPLLGGRDGSRTQRIALTKEATATVVEASGEGTARGLRVLGPPRSDASVARLLRAVARAGARAGSDAEPIVIRLTGAPPELTGGLTTVKAGWMLRTVRQLRTRGSLASEAASIRLSTPVLDPAEQPWSTLVRDANGATLVRAAASNDALVIDVAAGPDDVLAAAVVQAALDARVDDASYDEQEIVALDGAAVAAMTRQPGPVTREAWRAAETTDARWCWLAALALLGIEQWLRSRGLRAGAEELARAAA